MLKHEIMQAHKQTVKKGDYIVAKEIMELLRTGELTVIGYSDTAYKFESALEKIIRPMYSCDCRKVTFYMKEKFRKAN